MTVNPHSDKEKKDEEVVEELVVEEAEEAEEAEDEEEFLEPTLSSLPDNLSDRLPSPPNGGEQGYVFLTTRLKPYAGFRSTPSFGQHPFG